MVRLCYQTARLKALYILAKRPGSSFFEKLCVIFMKLRVLVHLFLGSYLSLLELRQETFTFLRAEAAETKTYENGLT